jgi:hypothetical protein
MSHIKDGIMLATEKDIYAYIQANGSASSFDIQRLPLLVDCPNRAAVIHRVLKGLVRDGLVTQQGQKRGTRYLLAGLES